MPSEEALVVAKVSRALVDTDVPGVEHVEDIMIVEKMPGRKYKSVQHIYFIANDKGYDLYLGEQA